KQYTNDVPVTIFNQCHSLHSVQLEKRWRYKLNRPFAGCRPFVIHTGEGTDRKSFEEINELLRWNLFSRRLVGVHGVAMDAIQAAGFDALVWCPVSNYFLLGATAQMKQLKKVTDILFGTDSALSAQWNAWHHLRDARKTRMLTDAELLAAITNKAAAVWGIRTAGTVRQGYDADIVVAEKNGVEGYDAFFAINPGNIQLVLHKGNIALFDAALLPQIAPSTGINHYSRIYINGRCKYVWGDLPALIKKIKTVAPDVQLPVGIE
ncbi:MAG TPA: amidohydrolase family protein, partial [Chitinophagaceae bacterium]|nr:amidohydrolase family protein [Chitinophagaceae bacterium]